MLKKVKRKRKAKGKGNLKTVNSYLIGGSVQFSLEHRYLNATAIFSSLACFAAGIINGYLNLSPVLIFQSFLLALVFAVLYYLARFRHMFGIIVWPLVLALLSCFAFQWVFNAGSRGGMQYFVFAGFATTIIILRGASRLVAFCLYSLTLGILLYIEFAHPELIVGYPSREARYSDVGISYLIGLALNGLVCIILSGNYEDAISLFAIERKRKESLLKREKELIERSRAELKRRNDAIEKELDIARAIQSSLLPKSIPSGKHIKIASCYYSMDKIGGDIYGFHELGDGSIAVYIADVAGHGISAAFVGSVAKQHIDTLIQSGYKPAEILEIVNARIIEITSSHFVSVFLGIFYSGGRFVFANGGHPFPIWYQNANGSIAEIEEHGRIVGIFPQEKWIEKEVTLRSGDRIILYTDGITESSDSEYELFGEDRLKEVILEQKEKDGANLINSILLSIREFSNKKSFDDDVTLITIDSLS